MGHGSHSRHVGAGTGAGTAAGGEGGQLQTHGFFLKSSQHMLLSPVHASAGSSKNTRSLAVDQMGFDHLTHTCYHVHGEWGGGACAKKHPFVPSLHGNGHTAGLLLLKESGKQNRAGPCVLTSTVWSHLDSTEGQHTQGRCVSAVKHGHCKVHDGTLS